MTTTSAEGETAFTLARSPAGALVASVLWLLAFGCSGRPGQHSIGLGDAGDAATAPRVAPDSQALVRTDSLVYVTHRGVDTIALEPWPYVAVSIGVTYENTTPVPIYVETFTFRGDTAPTPSFPILQKRERGEWRTAWAPLGSVRGDQLAVEPGATYRHRFVYKWHMPGYRGPGMELAGGLSGTYRVSWSAARRLASRDGVPCTARRGCWEAVPERASVSNEFRIVERE